MVGKKAVLMFVLLSLGLVAAIFHPAQSKLSAKIDFSGFAEGDIVGSLSVGTGISGDPIEGFVSVFGLNPRIPGKNTAMIFDANCTDGCTGEDDDLDFSRYNLGPVLIISEDLDLNDPDDADNEGAEFWFDFSEFDDGKVKVNRLTVADVDDREFGEIHVYQGGRNGTLVKTVKFEETPDNEIQTVEVDVKDIDYMVVDLNGSGAIDNIEIEVEINGKPKINLDGTCVPKGVYSEKLELTGTLKRDGDPIANHTITLSLPNGEKKTLKTKNNGHYEYIFEGARKYIEQDVTASATVDGQKTTDTHTITEADFAGCSDGIKITLNGECSPKNTPTNDLLLWGFLERDGIPISEHTIRLILPNEGVDVNTNEYGYYEHLFKEARPDHIGHTIKAVATVDGEDYPAEHKIAEENFDGCRGPRGFFLTGVCEKKAGQSESHDLRLPGKLTGSDGFGVPNHPITLDLPDHSEDITLNTDHKGEFSYLFEGAAKYIDTRVVARATLEGESLSWFYDITAADFEACQDKPKQYVCNNVKLTTFHGQPIDIGSQIPGWGLVDTNIECIGRGQGKSCRLVIKGQPGYVQKSDTLIIEKVPRLEPYVNYQAQIKGYDGAWTNKGCEFSFIIGGRVASVSSHLADQVDPLGWVYLGQGRNAIKPLGVCSGWSDACLFADNVIGFHFDDIYGNPLPGSKLAGLQPGDRVSIYRDHRLYTYEFTGSERVRQSAEGNQAILEAAEQHDLVLTTCSGYRLIDAGQFSHTRYATFKLLPRVESQHQWQ